MQALLALSSSFCAVKLCSLPLFFDFLPDAMEAAMEALGVLLGVPAVVTEPVKRRLLLARSWCLPDIVIFVYPKCQ
jgi:hypothetical protein